MSFVVVAREHVGKQSTQGKLAREHADTQDTLAREHAKHELVSTQGTSTREHARPVNM